MRGRVGRGRERAYAYFLYDPSKPMTEQSHDRLATIAQNTALGSGFDVAMKDLELRGTGNLLGDEQSGHIEGVGFDLYVRMVSETLFDVARLKFKARKLGVSEILAQSNRVRIGRIDPPESIQMRMTRIYKGTQYRPVTHQLIVPTPFTGSLGQGPMSSDQVVLWTNQLLDDLAWRPQR